MNTNQSWHSLIGVCLIGVAMVRPVEAVELFRDELATAWAAAEKTRLNLQTKPILDAKIQCEPWYAIGPFKDAEYGVFGRAFDATFTPEQDLLARGTQGAELDKTYASIPVAGAADSARRWTATSRVGGRLLQPASFGTATGP